MKLIHFIQINGQLSLLLNQTLRYKTTLQNVLYQIIFVINLWLVLGLSCSSFLLSSTCDCAVIPHYFHQVLESRNKILRIQYIVINTPQQINNNAWSSNLLFYKNNVTINSKTMFFIIDQDICELTPKHTTDWRIAFRTPC